MINKAVWFCLVCRLAIFAVPSAAQEDDKRLTLERVRQLIPLMPDQALAGEIRERAVKFTVLKSTLSDLTKLGAGTQTIAALQAVLFEGQLMVLTKPRRQNAVVTVDGAGSYRTLANGAVVLSDLAPGEHTIVVKNPPLYKDVQAKVDLIESRTTIEVALEAMKALAVAPGQLTVVAEEPDHLNLPASVAGKTYSWPLAAMGGIPPYEWSAAIDAVVGLSLSRTGVLSGTPKRAGTYRFVVRLRDGDLSETTQKIRLTVGPAEEGELIWKGSAPVDSVIIMNGGHVTPGTLQGEFPSVPFRIELAQNGVRPITVPGPENGWKVLVLHVERGSVAQIAIHWYALKR